MILRYLKHLTVALYLSVTWDGLASQTTEVLLMNEMNATLYANFMKPSTNFTFVDIAIHSWRQNNSESAIIYAPAFDLSDEKVPMVDLDNTNDHQLFITDFIVDNVTTTIKENTSSTIDLENSTSTILEIPFSIAALNILDNNTMTIMPEPSTSEHEFVHDSFYNTTLIGVMPPSDNTTLMFPADSVTDNEENHTSSGLENSTSTAVGEVISTGVSNTPYNNILLTTQEPSIFEQQFVHDSFYNTTLIDVVSPSDNITLMFPADSVTNNEESYTSSGLENSTSTVVGEVISTGASNTPYNNMLTTQEPSTLDQEFVHDSFYNTTLIDVVSPSHDITLMSPASSVTNDEENHTSSGLENSTSTVLGEVFSADVSNVPNNNIMLTTQKPSTFEQESVYDLFSLFDDNTSAEVVPPSDNITEMLPIDEVSNLKLNMKCHYVIPASLNHRIIMTFSKLGNFTRHTDIPEMFKTLLRLSFNDSLCNSVVQTSFIDEGILTFTWANFTATEKCDPQNLLRLQNAMLNNTQITEEFSKKFLPLFKLHNVTIERLGNCVSKTGDSHLHPVIIIAILFLSISPCVGIFVIRLIRLSPKCRERTIKDVLRDRQPVVFDVEIGNYTIRHSRYMEGISNESFFQDEANP